MEGEANESAGRCCVLCGQRELAGGRAAFTSTRSVKAGKPGALGKPSSILTRAPGSLLLLASSHDDTRTLHSVVACPHVAHVLPPSLSPRPLSLSPGPRYWKDLAKGCGGDNQSPINIDRRKVQRDRNLGDILFEGYDQAPPGKWKLMNNGHTGGYLCQTPSLPPSLAPQTLFSAGRCTAQGRISELDSLQDSLQYDVFIISTVVAAGSPVMAQDPMVRARCWTNTEHDPCPEELTVLHLALLLT